MSSPVAASSLAVVRQGGSFALVTTVALERGEEILVVTGRETAVPTRHSLQVGALVHVDVSADVGPIEALDVHPWRFLNHSCDPNARFVGRSLIARRAIAPWTAVTFDYATTEWDMAEPFDCSCVAIHCRGVVRGHRWLSRDDASRIAHMTQPWLVR